MQHKLLATLSGRVAAALLLVTLTIFAMQAYFLQRNAADLYAVALEKRAEVNLASAIIALSAADEDRIHEVVEQLMDNREVFGLEVEYDDQRVRFIRNENWKPVPRMASDSLPDDIIVRQATFSRDRGASSARATLYQTPAYMQNEVKITLATMVLAAIFLSVFTSVVLYALLWAVVFLPLGLLHKYVVEYDFLDKHESDTSLKNLPPELKAIADAFDTVSQQIKQHLRELDAANQRFKLAFRKFPLPLGIYDAKTLNVEYVNERFVDTFGYEREDVPTLDIWDEKAFPDEAYRREIRKNWESKLAEQSGIFSTLDPDERCVRCKDGSMKYVQIGGLFAIEEGFVEGIFIDVTEKHRAESELLAQQKKLRELAAHIQDVREEESKHIARELHDELGKILTVARVDLAGLAEKLPPDAVEIRKGLELQLKSLDLASDTTRRLSESLRPGILDLLGLAAALENHVKRFTQSTAIPVTLNIGDLDGLELDDSTTTTAFRIVQESLTNIARYAQADAVEVYVDNLGDELLIVVKDNGIGMDMAAIHEKDCFGLLGMRERAEAQGGRLTIESEPGKGVRLEASFPRNEAGNSE